jgi:hypothetical protein
MIATNELDEDLEPNMEGQIEELVKLLDTDADALPLGPDATNAIGVIQDYIQDDSLFQRLRRAAKADPDNDAKPVIIGWMSENIDSDSAYEEVLDQIEQDESEQLPTTSPVTNPEPVPPPNEPSKMNSDNKDSEIKTPDISKEPISAPPIKEFDELSRIKQLAIK